VFQAALQQAIDVHNGGVLPPPPPPGASVSDLVEYAFVLALISIYIIVP
jgi:hypothetical protein